MAREGLDVLTPLLRMLDNIRADMQDQIRIMTYTRSIQQWREAKAAYDSIKRRYNRLRDGIFRDFGRVEGYGIIHRPKLRR